MKVLTFDLEEWYLYKRNNLGSSINYLPRLQKLLDRVLCDLDKFNYKATFFCLGSIAQEYPEIIKKIHHLGHEIACHSNRHSWLTDLSRKEVVEDTKTAVDLLEQVIGEKVKGYRAPAFSITEKNLWVLEVLASTGIEYDASIFPSNRDFGGFPSFASNEPVIINYNGIRLKEFPVGTTKVLGKDIAYSGGGYFRLLPYNIIKNRTKANDYVMSYFHLRDFDIEQTKQSLNLARYFKSYYGITSAYTKFLKYIDDFEFINIEKAIDLTEWGKTHIVDL